MHEAVNTLGRCLLMSLRPDRYVLPCKHFLDLSDAHNESHSPWTWWAAEALGVQRVLPSICSTDVNPASYWSGQKLYTSFSASMGRSGSYFLRDHTVNWPEITLIAFSQRVWKAKGSRYECIFSRVQACLWTGCYLWAVVYTMWSV